MVSSLSNLVKNLSEEIHEIKCKYRHSHKKWKTCGMEYKYCNCFIEYLKDDVYVVTKIVNKSLMKS